MIKYELNKISRCFNLTYNHKNIWCRFAENSIHFFSNNLQRKIMLNFTLYVNTKILISIIYRVLEKGKQRLSNENKNKIRILTLYE